MMIQFPLRHPSLAISFVAVAATVCLPTLPVAAKPKAAPVAAKKDAPAPAVAKPPKAKVVPDNLTAPEEPSPVPAAGPLNLEQLVALALFNNPEVLRRRGDAEVARAKRKAATDLRDPEFRFAYSTQTDVEVGSPYTERTISNEHYSGTEFQQEGTYGIGINEFRIDTERTRNSEDRYRYVEQRVIPGATRDKIITDEYESRRQSSRGIRHRVDGKNGLNEYRNDRVSEKGSRRQVGHSVSYRYHDDVTDPSDAYEFLLRFYFPNPWEMRAKIRVADAEIRQADYMLNAAENEVIMEVRALYEDVAYYEALGGAESSLRKEQEGYLKIVRTLFPDKIAGVTRDAASSGLKATAAALKGAERRRDLARLIGLADPTRISVPKGFRQRRIDLRSAKLEYLIEMARIYRSDLAVLHAKYDVATAEYQAVQAEKIPAIGFADVAYGKQSDRRGRDETEIQFRVGMSLPLFSWLFNDADKVPEAAARSYSRQIGRLSDGVVSDVISSYESLRAAERMISAFESQTADAAKLAKEAAAAALISDKMEQATSESRQLGHELEINRLDAYRLYNQAVLDLERALGTRLEKILTPGGK